MQDFPISGYFFKWWIIGKGVGSKNSGENNTPQELSSVELVILALFILFLLFLLYYIVTTYLEKKKKGIVLTEELPENRKVIIAKFFPFYNQLSGKRKLLFEKRVQYFIKTRMFTTQEGFGVTEDMKVLVSAAAIQLTFGLKNFNEFSIGHFHIIKDEKRNDIVSQRLQNAFIIYWKLFYEGFENNTDGKNDGLKSLAIHLLKVYQFQKKGDQFFSESSYSQWIKAAQEESSIFLGGIYARFETDSSLRNELFGQAVVYYFELPEAFKQKYPQLFKATEKMLNLS